MNSCIINVHDLATMLTDAQCGHDGPTFKL